MRFISLNRLAMPIQAYSLKRGRLVAQITAWCLGNPYSGCREARRPPMRPSNTASGVAADPRVAALRHITADELRGLGTHQIVYLRAGKREGEWVVALY